ncbi:hypothetical protein [Pseudoalteromonas sp. SR41-4]|uniref:hypothetical protein n=1 Tax=Pseudoalteromonas sp. SR41-4 TaxID=2760950 RepID=UPI001603B684|nr:hypothetical protein [Pseudoalteromonas sp. SR41-4]MBB1295537.1 hypothetical protein [Pseudoalteromonas sp. SR41-4]
MKGYLIVGVITAVFAVTAVAQEGEREGEHHMMMGKMMHDKETSHMEPKMRQMFSLMQQIENENNPQKREQLMEQHMNSMRANMRMINDLNESGDDSESETEGDERINKMEGQLRMMQVMMDQMMEHSSYSEMKMLQKHRDK